MKKLLVVAILAMAFAACGGKKAPATMPATTGGENEMAPEGGATGGSTYGGDMYGGASYGAPAM
jgi:hypothetical protein